MATDTARKVRSTGAQGVPWQKVEALVLDCDGVLTAGGLEYDSAGQRQLRFDAKDGFALALACRSGLPVGVLSGRPTDVAEARHRELGIAAFVGRCTDKAAGLRTMCEGLGVSPQACAFLGDDLPDLPAFAAAGFALAVADAVDEVRARAHYICRHAGGRGAVREVLEHILKARGVWQATLERLSSGAAGPAAEKKDPPPSCP